MIDFSGVGLVVVIFAVDVRRMKQKLVILVTNMMSKCHVSRNYIIHFRI
jgi:hypothetical protein